MARTDSDTWDLASSVGATATGWPHRAHWRPNGPTRSSTTRSPTHWSRPSASITATEWRTANSTSTDDPLLDRRAMSEQIAVRTRLLRRFLHHCRSGGHSAGGDPRLRPRHPGLPVAVAAGHGDVRDRPATGHRVQDPLSLADLGRHAPADRRPSRSIFATTGRKRCETAGLIRHSQRHGSPRAC